MIKKLKDWANKEKDQAYKNYCNSRSESDADNYQGQYAAVVRLMYFIKELEEEYKDDFK